MRYQLSLEYIDAMILMVLCIMECIYLASPFFIFLQVLSISFVDNHSGVFLFRPDLRRVDVPDSSCAGYLLRSISSSLSASSRPAGGIKLIAGYVS